MPYRGGSSRLVYYFKKPRYFKLFNSQYMYDTFYYDLLKMHI